MENQTTTNAVLENAKKLNAATIYENRKDALVNFEEVDFFIRLIERNITGIMMQSIKDSKKEFFAVKNEQFFLISAIPTDTNKKTIDVLNEINEKEKIEKVVNYENACERFEKLNPNDTRTEYDCFSWFKNSKTVIIAPNYSQMGRPKLPNETKKVIKSYSEI